MNPSEILNDPRLKDALPELLAGTGGALAGGLMSGGRRSAQGESRGKYLARVLANAAMAGTMAAGGTALLRKGYDSTLGAVDKSGPLTGSKPENQGPLASAWRGLAFSPLTAAGTGAAALAATHDSKSGLLGRDKGLIENAKGILGQELGLTPDKMDLAKRRGAIPELINAAAGGDDEVLKALNKLRGEAGIAGKGALSRVAHSWPFKTFGTTTSTRIRRGGLGLAAAGVPALIGALTTSEQ